MWRQPSRLAASARFDVAQMNRRAAFICALLAALCPCQAMAQRDLSGEWSARYHEDQEHRIPGPALGDYTGLPINDAARLKADSWDASILSLREHQAKPHPSTYSLRGPANIRVSKEVDAHPGEGRDTDVRLRRAVRVSGRVHRSGVPRSQPVGACRAS